MCRCELENLWNKSKYNNMKKSFCPSYSVFVAKLKTSQDHAIHNTFSQMLTRVLRGEFIVLQVTRRGRASGKVPFQATAMARKSPQCLKIAKRSNFTTFTQRENSKKFQTNSDTNRKKLRQFLEIFKRCEAIKVGNSNKLFADLWWGENKSRVQ